MEFTARRYDTGQVVTVSIDDGRIDSITHADGPDSQNVPWVSPGFVDLQINGYGGQEFNGPGSRYRTRGSSLAGQ